MELIPKMNKTNNSISCEKDCVDCLKVSLPNIGDTMKIVVNDWGYEVLQNHSHIRHEQNVIEVEVKSIKVAKLVLE